MAVVGQLLVELSANVARLRTDMERASGLVEQHTRRMASAASIASGALSAIGAGLSIGAIASQFGAAVNALAALDDAAESTGASVEGLSSLLNTLAPTGVTLDQIADAAGKLTKSMAGAGEDGSKAAEAFKAIGVATQDAAGNLRPVDDVMVDVARSLAQFEDGTNKVVIAQALFGKSGAALLPMLKDLASRQREGATVTGEQAAAAESLANAYRQLKYNGELMSQSIAGKIIPDLARLAEQFRATAQAGGSFWESLRGALGPNKFVAELEADLRALQQRRDRLAADNRPLMQRGKDEGLAALDRQIADIQARIERLRPAQRISGAVQDQMDGVTPGGAGGPRGQAPKLPADGAADAAKRAAEAYRELDALIAQADADDNLKQQAAQAKALADELDRAASAALRRIAANDAAEADADEAIKRDVERIRSAVDPTRELYRAVDRVQDLMRGGLLPDDVGNARLMQLYSEIDGILQGLPDRVAEAQSGMRDMLAPIESAFEAAIFRGEKLSTLLGSLAQDFARMMLRQHITGPLSQLLTGTFDPAKSSGTLVGMVMGAISGSRAEGGHVTAGYPYLVGERGAEIVAPRHSGTVIPNAGGGGPATIVQHFDMRNSALTPAVIEMAARRGAALGQAQMRDARVRGAEVF